jgi:hypothetical protein
MQSAWSTTAPLMDPEGPRPQAGRPRRAPKQHAAASQSMTERRGRARQSGSTENVTSGVFFNGVLCQLAVFQAGCTAQTLVDAAHTEMISTRSSNRAAAGCAVAVPIQMISTKVQEDWVRLHLKGGTGRCNRAVSTAKRAS